MAEVLALALLVALALVAALAVAFFRLRRRHRCCRHCLGQVRVERDRLKVRLGHLEMRFGERIDD